MNIDVAAKIVWGYHHLNMPVEAADIILVLGSRDDRVANFAAELFLKGLGKYLVFSGGVAHKSDLLRTDWHTSEAEHFAELAIQRGVDPNKIILEDKSTNTGENIRFTYEVLQYNNIKADSILLVQKPYMERRSYATFKKQWPDTSTNLSVTSEPIDFENYINDENPKDTVINIMVGDLQRIIEYPKMGYQIEQDVPANVLEAMNYLISRGYTKHLLKD